MFGLFIFLIVAIVVFVLLVVWGLKSGHKGGETIRLTKSATSMSKEDFEKLEADKKKWEELEKEAIKNGHHYSKTVITTTVSSTGEKTVSVQDTEFNQKIACKSCGCSINIDKDPVCPQCGAAYDIAEAKAESAARIQKLLEKQEQTQAYKQVY